MTDDRECRMYLREFVMYRLTARPSDEPWEDTISAFLAARRAALAAGYREVVVRPSPRCLTCGSRWRESDYGLDVPENMIPVLVSREAVDELREWQRNTLSVSSPSEHSCMLFSRDLATLLHDFPDRLPDCRSCPSRRNLLAAPRAQAGGQAGGGDTWLTTIREMAIAYSRVVAWVESGALAEVINSPALLPEVREAVKGCRDEVRRALEG